jgi:hypothetical protein
MIRSGRRSETSAGTRSSTSPSTPARATTGSTSIWAASGRDAKVTLDVSLGGGDDSFRLNAREDGLSRSATLNLTLDGGAGDDTATHNVGKLGSQSNVKITTVEHKHTLSQGGSKMTAKTKTTTRRTAAAGVMRTRTIEPRAG